MAERIIIIDEVFRSMSEGLAAINIYGLELGMEGMGAPWECIGSCF